MANREKEGKLGSTKLRLATWRPEPYRKRTQLVLPDRQDVPGDPGKILIDPNRRLWRVDSWRGGEGENRWRQDRADQYNVSSNVRPKRVGDGVVLGTGSVTTDVSTGGNYGEADRLVYGHGKLWALRNEHVAEWVPGSEHWLVGTNDISTGAVTRAAAGSAGGVNYLYVGKVQGTIRRYDVDGDTWSTQMTTAGWASEETLPVMYEGVLYALNDGDLYTVDTSTTDTATQVYDEIQPFVNFREALAYDNSLTVSDVGPTWVVRYDDGTARIHEFNHFTATHKVIAELPSNVWPTSILHTFGLTFVAFRQTDTAGGTGLSYIFYVNTTTGATGSIGPIRETTDSTGAYLAGTLGDDLVLVFDKKVWAYNLSAGGLAQIGTNDDDKDGEQALLVGNDLFLSGMSGPGGELCEWWQLDEYATTGTLDSGRFDLGYPEATKLLNRVIVNTDPLPANTSVQLSYSVDGGAFTTHADTMDTDNATSYTFVISDETASVTGVEFEIRLTLNSSSVTATPTVLSWTAEAFAGEKRTEYLIEADAGEYDTAGATAGELDRLNTIAATNTIQQFDNPWEKSEEDAPATSNVIVLSADNPEEGAQSQKYATIVLREV